MIDSTALWADGVVIELLLPLVRIKDVIFLGMSSDPGERQQARECVSSLASFESLFRS
jgi:hypothetical protein